MKPIVFFIALSLVTTGGYAQNKSCVYTNKYSAKPHHYKAAVKPVVSTETDVPEVIEKIIVIEPACLTYQKHNIVVRECPDVFYDDQGNAKYIPNSAALEYHTESFYSGYYPDKKAGNDNPKPADANKTSHPENTEVDQGSYNNMCFWNCPRK